MTLIKVAKVYSAILGEERIEVIFERKGREFWGALFWEKDEDNVVKEVIETVEINACYESNEVLNSIQKYIELSIKHGRKVYNDTLSTMLHWQYVHGFSSKIF